MGPLEYTVAALILVGTGYLFLRFYLRWYLKGDGGMNSEFRR